MLRHGDYVPSPSTPAGFGADTAALFLEPDIRRLVDVKLISSDWKKKSGGSLQQDRSLIAVSAPHERGPAEVVLRAKDIEVSLGSRPVATVEGSVRFGALFPAHLDVDGAGTIRVFKKSNSPDAAGHRNAQLKQRAVGSYYPVRLGLKRSA